ncbi:MAG: ribonuclease III [Microcoleaceae cyanobacterium]
MSHPLFNFDNQQLLRQALTHRSYVNENPLLKEEDNERLEFLGDAILNFLSGQYWYNKEPPLGEDEMTRRRAALVNEKQLARFAVTIGLDLKMRLGKGAIREGGFQNDNLLSSTFEAVVGAYYLDKGSNVEEIRPLIEQLFASVPEQSLSSRSNVDVKNQLQEWVQANLGPITPWYKTEKIGGPDHSPHFSAQVLVDQQEYGQGEGRSKKDAEKQAAEDALVRLKHQGKL